MERHHQGKADRRADHASDVAKKRASQILDMALWRPHSETDQKRDAFCSFASPKAHNHLSIRSAQIQAG